MPDSPLLPRAVEVVGRTQESPTVFTLRLRYLDDLPHTAYQFVPGQFNMLYLHGLGEVPISIVSDPQDAPLLDHTVRAVGRVTGALQRLTPGAQLGLRGPYGRGWPLAQAQGRDVLIITGGLGCAPTVSVINYIVRRRRDFGRLVIVQGVKHADDLIWREQYAQWSRMPDTQVLVAADVGASLWPWHVGRVTELFDRAEIDVPMTLALLCGPEGMMRVAIEHLAARGLAPEAIWLSMERSMHCAIGLCGHCQLGGWFVCKDGPVFCYKDVMDLLGRRGF
jgi:NAD(P)H-flavin reductase